MIKEASPLQNSLLQLAAQNTLHKWIDSRAPATTTVVLLIIGKKSVMDEIIIRESLSTLNEFKLPALDELYPRSLMKLGYVLAIF